MSDGRPGAPVSVAGPKPAQAQGELDFWATLPEPHRAAFRALATARDEIQALLDVNNTLENDLITAWQTGMNDALNIVVQLALKELGWPPPAKGKRG